MKKIIVISMLVIAIACFGVTASFAKLYSASPYGQGTSTVGVGGDYPNLYAASVDFSTTANTGPWVVQILSNLSEPSSLFWGNYVPFTSSVTIEPAPGVNAIVTFTETSVTEAGAELGHFVVGLNNATTFTVASVCNFTINGSNNGTNSKNLTFLRGDTGYSNNYMIRVTGAVPNFTLENCSILNRYATETTASGATTDFTGYGVYIDIDVVATGNDWEPDNFQILNNYIEVTAGGAWYEDTRAIYAGNNVGNGLTNGTDRMLTGWTISGNTLVACNRTIYFYRAQSGTISNNSVLTYHFNDVYHGGGLPIGLWTGYNNAHATYGPLDANGYQGTENIYGNYWLSYAYDSQVGATDNIAIGLDGNLMKYNVYNNQIIVYYAGTLIQSTVTNTEAGIYLDVAEPPTGSIINILDNSIDIPNNPVLTYNTSGRFGFAIYDAINGFDLNIENNLFRMGQPGAYGYDFYSTGSNMTTICDYNTFYIASGIAGRLAALADFTTFAAWTTSGAGYDVHGQFLDPDAMTGHWISDSNLSFSADPTQLLAGTTNTPIAITSDFFGNARSTTAPYRGAVEIPAVKYSPVPVVAHPGGSATISISGGQAPYSLNTSALAATIGFVNSTTGSSISFTAGSIITTGQFITITDSYGNTAQVTISVTPTSAPLVNDITMATMERKDVVRFDLFQ